MEIKEQLIACLNNMGIEIDANEKDVDLRGYFEDSLMFISAIVEFENFLGIEIPDELLLYDKFSSLNSFSIELQEVIEQNTTN